MKAPHSKDDGPPRWDVRPSRNPAAAGGKRRCPICDLVTDESLCPEHAMATLLIDVPSPSVAQLEVGSVIGGRYVIKRVIGKGGYGAVFEATHTGTGQGVAVKTLAPGLETDDTALKRFFQEARVTSGLRHPNTIRVFDFGQDDTGLIYLAMELLTGFTLKQELKRRQKDGRVFTEKEAIEIGVAITKSLGEAHAAGLVHRDLKPDNVFLHLVQGDDPVIKVLDFGIVKLANSSLTLGSDSGIPGTPAYMSPEQVLKRGELDGRSDLYSLGVVLYNLVTGTVPFKGSDVMQTLYMHIHEPVPDVAAAAKTPISENFADLIRRALSKDPEQRPKDAREFRTLLSAASEVDSGPTAAPFTGELEAPTSSPVKVDQKRAALMWLALAVVMLAVGVLGTLVSIRFSESETQIVFEAPAPPPVKQEESVQVVEQQPSVIPIPEEKPPEIKKAKKRPRDRDRDRDRGKAGNVADAVLDTKI